MYCLASKVNGLPIVSLQTSEAIARAGSPIIDLASLEILAFHCRSVSGNQPLVLMSRDIRQFATDCIIVDTDDELAGPGDIVRLQPPIKAAYSPLGKTVVSDSGRRLGNVDDFTINVETNQVQKLYVSGGFLRWLGTSAVVDRTQIIDITPHRITVREATAKSPLMQTEPMPESPS